MGEKISTVVNLAAPIRQHVWPDNSKTRFPHNFPLIGYVTVSTTAIAHSLLVPERPLCVIFNTVIKRSFVHLNNHVMYPPPVLL